jgi:hypothetical protein
MAARSISSNGDEEPASINFGAQWQSNGRFGCSTNFFGRLRMRHAEETEYSRQVQVEGGGWRLRRDDEQMRSAREGNS